MENRESRIECRELSMENQESSVENRAILDSILDPRFSQGSRIECQLTFERYCTCS